MHIEIRRLPRLFKVMHDLRTVVTIQNKLRGQTITDPSATWRKYRLFATKVDKFLAYLNGRIAFVGGL